MINSPSNGIIKIHENEGKTLFEEEMKDKIRQISLKIGK